jgi:hypothetical protein
LIQIYALEGFLDRLVRSVHADHFVLKGGVLPAALDARRPTRDIDLVAHDFENNAAHVLGLIREVAAIEVDDGLVFDAEHGTAETIRDDDHYSGVRVTLGESSRAPSSAYTLTSMWVTRSGLSHSKSGSLDYSMTRWSFEAIRRRWFSQKRSLQHLHEDRPTPGGGTSLTSMCSFGAKS